MTRTPYATTSRKTILSEVTEFGVTDAKGRKIGMLAYAYEHAVELIADLSAHRGSFRYLEFAPIDGKMIEVNTIKTLNGERYGASNSSHHFATRAEADAYIAKRIKDSRKKAGA